MNNVIQFPTKAERILRDFDKHYPRISELSKSYVVEPKTDSKSRRKPNFTFAYGSPGAPKL